jgi:hypothetical protein
MSGGQPSAPPAHATAILAWIVIALGSFTFLAGASLMACALITRRNELWNFGMPLTLTGQFNVLLGLVLLLSHLRRANRRTTDILDDVNRRLHEIGAMPTAVIHPSRSPATRFSHS